MHPKVADKPMDTLELGAPLGHKKGHLFIIGSCRSARMTNRRLKATAIPMPLAGELPVAHVPTTFAVPVVARPKQRIEPARTSKTTQKLIVFPEADLEDAEGEGAQESLSTATDVPVMLDAHDKPQALRRVTAYLTAESYRLRDMADKNAKGRSSFYDSKRFDEVLYTPYYVNCDKSSLETDLETAVASSASVGEVFVFDYGVVVIWGLDESDERKVLRELQPFEIDRLDMEDVEVENFSFCHNADRPPRLFNDIINLRSGHHLVKLTISHSLAQSVKLAYFENVIDNTILNTKNIPYELLSTGTIAMSRKQITVQIGELFAMRMNVNLISNVLDTPELFWSYPSLGPLYRAVRCYLEISQRVEVLNQRCAVLSDMLDMLRDHANIMHGEKLELIIIGLITLEIFVGLVHIALQLSSHH